MSIIEQINEKERKFIASMPSCTIKPNLLILGGRTYMQFCMEVYEMDHNLRGDFEVTAYHGMKIVFSNLDEKIIVALEAR